MYFVIVYRDEVHKNHEYIQNVKMAMLKSPAPRSWARIFHKPIFNFSLYLGWYIGKSVVKFLNIFKMAMLKYPAPQLWALSQSNF